MPPALPHCENAAPRRQSISGGSLPSAGRRAPPGRPLLARAPRLQRDLRGRGRCRAANPPPEPRRGRRPAHDPSARLWRGAPGVFSGARPQPSQRVPEGGRLAVTPAIRLRPRPPDHQARRSDGKAPCPCARRTPPRRRRKRYRQWRCGHCRGPSSLLRNRRCGGRPG